MQITVLNNNKPMGKLHTTSHPIKGKFVNKQFTSHQEFAQIITQLKPNQCFTVGLYPNGVKYAPSNDASIRSTDTLSRSANNATPGHVLCIDNDLEEFGDFDVHKFLSTHVPDIFNGAGYVRTMSSSHYLKGKNTWHHYYLFEHPHNFGQLMGLIERVLKEHEQIGYSFASNFSQTYITTPLDIKLRELQQPIFEFTTADLNAMVESDEQAIADHQGTPNKVINQAQLTIQVQAGEVHSARQLAIPDISTPNAEINASQPKQSVEAQRKELFDRAHEHLPPKERYELQQQYTNHKLTGDFALHLYDPDNAPKVPRVKTVEELYTDHYTTKEPLHTLFYQPGEPEYADRQMAKLFPDTHRLKL